MSWAASLPCTVLAVAQRGEQPACLGPTPGAIRAVPSLAWVPLLILWLKIGEDSKSTPIAIGAFFPVYTTVSAVLLSVGAGLRLALAQSLLFLVAIVLLALSGKLTDALIGIAERRLATFWR